MGLRHDSRHAMMARCQMSTSPGTGAPATRALASIGITRLDHVAGRIQAELLALHGFGPRPYASSTMHSPHAVSQCVPERGSATRFPGALLG